MKNPLFIENVYLKLEALNEACDTAFKSKKCFPVPETVIRDIPTDLDYKAKKVGLSKPEGQARLFHDLANIELQAMELGLRTLFEFPDAPKQFRRELVELTKEEALHLSLCLEQLERLGFSWGHWSAPPLLWNATHSTDTLIERILIVHRYLEGSGLDASQEILKKLSGVKNKELLHCVDRIATDEIKHVHFGNRWFHYFCEEQKLDPLKELQSGLQRLDQRLPVRNANINHKLRLEAGFIEEELAALESFMKLRNFEKQAVIHRRESKPSPQRAHLIEFGQNHHKNNGKFASKC